MSAPSVGASPVDQLQADLFKALSHPTRLSLVEALLGGERSTTELVQELGIEPASVSQQLGVLRQARLVQSRREGAATVFRLATPLIDRLLELARQILSASLAQTRALLVALEGADDGGMR